MYFQNDNAHVGARGLHTYVYTYDTSFTDDKSQN